MDFTIFVIGIAANMNIIESLESFIKHFLDVLIISMFSNELHKGCQVNVCVWLHIHIGDNIILGQARFLFERFVNVFWQSFVQIIGK
jgi:hypothetical protein